MLTGYFHRVTQETDTRFWINNPTLGEVEAALAAGAVSCTTNPAFCARLIADDGEYVRRIIDGVVPFVDDDDAAAERVYQRACAPIAERFLPLYEASGGAGGFVTIQGDPRRDDDPDFIVDEALRHRQVSRNVMAKIPAHQAGIAAIEALVERDVPICATEIFSVAQAICVGEAYRRASRKSGKQPPLFVTHITGIFDKYLSEYVQSHSIDIAPEVLAHAGWAAAHEQYRVSKERGYAGIMLGGGALNTSHFTEMVGGDMHVTLNWSIAQELIAADGPVASCIDVPAPKAMVEELSAKLPAFRQALPADGLSIEGFKDYGPLVLFRNMFLQGYGRLVQEIGARRAAKAVRAA